MIGSDVKKVREYLDLSQQEMADILCLRLSYYKTIEYTMTRPLNRLSELRLLDYIQREHKDLYTVAQIIDYLNRLE